MNRTTMGLAVLALAGAWVSPALAQDEGSGATPAASASASTEGVSLSAAERAEDNYLELGIFAGALFPSSSHNFQDSSAEERRLHLKFKSVAPEVGLRFGYYPIRYLGIEAEGMYAPTQTEDDESASLWAIRGHLVGQLPLGAATPFAVLGGGRMAGKSSVMGTDSDPALHFGIGVKVPVSRALSLRFDARDNMTQKDDTSDGTQTHHPELTLGLSYTFGLSKKPAAPPPPADSDGDGFVDSEDKCPNEAGVAPDGCPELDADKDGIPIPQDKCPAEVGVAPDGCPELDADKDGIPIPQDKCPNEAGVAPDGCPDLDADKDGVPTPQDKCPNEPETKNGYLDEDGCPDEIPEEVKKFTGVIAGIEFDTGKATIRKKSEPTLDGAAKILTEYPTLRIEISGHTDDVGPHDKNVTLSQERADSVKTYLVGKGVDAKRITTRGAGPDEPIADNKTAAGKQKNRRIEFKLLTQ
ncbi:MAG: OmpA family protein [Sorangiineae bacterium]|nr:OmpA family protein [Polyangiaceae bacterium]MEB2324495.1 OmpA family protein [Sorangiineae bacterium]